MTTNNPEQLDDALVRPGRIDRKVEFHNATTKQSKTIFERMYTQEPRQTRAQASAKTAAPSTIADVPVITLNGVLNSPSNGETCYVTSTVEEREKLSVLASQFAEHIPDGAFSPAAIQGFLLNHKNEPDKACRDIKSWVEERLQQNNKMAAGM